MPQHKAQSPARLLIICLALAPLLAVLPGCPPAPPPQGPALPTPAPRVEGTRYTIQRGDTLYSIARANGVLWSDIMRVNPGLDPRDLTVGQAIIIPQSHNPLPPSPPVESPRPAFNPGRPGPIAAESSFAWPVEGELIGKFQQRVPWRRGETNDGIDIRASEGAAVVAAKSGQVNTFSRFPGYGKTVILEHADGSITFYCYLKEVLCSHGTWVGQGEVIGTVGQTGLSSGPELHFRIWQGTKFVDPTGLLK